MGKEYKGTYLEFIGKHLARLRRKCFRMLLVGDGKADKLKMIYKG